MKIKFRWSEKEFTLYDLTKLLRKHAKEVVIDGDHKVVIVTDPDEYLLEELENRGVEWVVVE